VGGTGARRERTLRARSTAEALNQPSHVRRIAPESLRCCESPGGAPGIVVPTNPDREGRKCQVWFDPQRAFERGMLLRETID